VRWSLFAAFAAVIVFLSGSVLAVSLRETGRLAENIARPLIVRVSELAHTELDLLFEPIESAIIRAHSWVRTGQVQRRDSTRLMRLFSPEMMSLPQCVSMMVSDMTGYEFTIFRNESGGEIDLPPGRVQWTTRDFRADDWGKTGHWTLWCENGEQPLRTWEKDQLWSKAVVEGAKPSGALPFDAQSGQGEELIYDPRPRMWHEGARERMTSISTAELSRNPRASIYWTDVDFFFTSKAPGITASIAAVDPTGDVVVVGFDLLFRDLSEFTSKMKPTSNGSVLVFTKDEKVVGLPALLGQKKSHADASAVLEGVDELGVPVLRTAMNLWRDRNGSPIDSIRFEHDGEAFFFGVSPYKISPTTVLWTLVLVPERDLIAQAKTQRRSLLLSSLGALGVALLLVMLLSKSFSTPLKKLVEKSARIKQLELRASPETVPSRLTEIVSLSNALEDMRRALCSHVEERQRAEASLRQANARLSGVLGAIPDLLFEVTEDGDILDAKTSKPELLLTPLSDILGRNLGSALPAEAASVVFEALAESTATGSSFGRIYSLDVHGERKWFEMSVALKEQTENENERGSPGKHKRHFISIVRDVTERKDAEEERLRLEQEILRARHLESLGLLAGGIAHDFNNLLMGVQGYADLALTTVDKDGPLASYLGRIQTASIRLAELTNQVLAFSGKGQFVVEPVSLLDLIEEMLQLLRTAIPRHVVTRIERPSSLCIVDVDASQMRQVVMNLVKNAADSYGAEKGEIIVRISEKAIRDTQRIVLEVSDFGCGMDEATQKRIFDPFFTTKKTGRGLGLAAVGGIVRAHGGTIEVQSSPGEGTTFFVTLPASKAALSTAKMASSPNKIAAGETILVVDDEPVVRDVGALLLKSLGFSVVAAGSGHEALDYATSAKEKLAAVLLDVTMPGMNGIATHGALRELFPSLPIVFSSGYSTEDSLGRLGRETATWFIQKPYSRDKLAAIMAKALGTLSNSN
jgi:nitrogen-specific signal transduction histidine kinase/PAS domain-containing protein/ActR/RegA family two-component response regulator